MLSYHLLSAAAILFSPLASADATPLIVLAANVPNFVIYNTINVYLKSFGATLAADSFSALQTTLDGTPVASLNNVIDPLRFAFNAGVLEAGQQGLTIADQVQKCINSIVLTNGAPTAWQCSSSAVNSFISTRDAFNLVLDQFVGIVPPNTFTAIANIGIAEFTTVENTVGLTHNAAMLANINAQLLSLIVTSTQSTIGAIKLFETCLAATVAAPSTSSASCFAGPSSPYVGLTTVTAGILSQFVGALPNTVVARATNIIAYYFSLPAGPPAMVQAAIASALIAVTSTTSGSTANYGLQLQQCISNAIMMPTFDCLGPVAFNQPQLLVNGVIQQFFGYLAPTIIINAEKAVAPIFASSPTPSQAVVQTVLNAVLASAGVGTYSAACGQALENCVLAALIGGSGCIPAVKGCNILPIQ